MEKTVLIVEDSMMFGRMLQRCMRNELGFTSVWVQSMEEAREYLAKGNRPTVAILDYCLPDALDGEVVEMAHSFGIPSILTSADYSDNLQEFAWSRRVLDLVVKDGSQAFSLIIDIVDRISKNADTGVLIVDDSRTARNHLRNLLEPWQFHIYEACDGYEALEQVDRNPEIRLVLTDYYMPRCDGFELTKALRKNYAMDRLSIIGLSARGDHQTTVQFIKNGANDFLGKPFISEMLLCRINQNLRIVEHFDTFRELAMVDHLTNISNRRHLNEAGDIVFENGMRTGDYPVVAMMDLDNFKRINDQYGHDMGDHVLAGIARKLRMTIRKSDILSRYGGEEFCMVCQNMDPKKAASKFDKWRQLIETMEFCCGEERFGVTVSIGLCTKPQESFQAMVKHADLKLYEAKKAGKNCVR
ncbi:MAG: diguanylate cyclase [Spirochaetales bacterium]|nr:diguanylate cyclase [Spirochaetales bacterium]